MSGSPAARLLAAADLLDKRADEAAKQIRGFGPGDYYWGASYSAIQRDGMGGGLGDYAATMTPDVGRRLAASLREAADTIDRNGLLAAQGKPLVRIASAFLLDLADALLAGEAK